MKIEKGVFITKEQLINTGWKFHHGIGKELQVWEQKNEVCFFNPLAGQITGVYPKNVKL